MFVSSIQFTSNIPNNLSQKKSDSVSNMSATSITSSYDDSKSNQAILNNLSFRGFNRNPDDEVVKEATKLVTEPFHLHKKHQFDLNFLNASTEMGHAGIEQIENEDYIYIPRMYPRWDSVIE